MPDLFSFSGLLQHAAPDMPPQAWWMTGLVLMLLAAVSIIDAVKAIVPDPLIFIGVVAVTAVQGIYHSWPYAAHNLGWGLGIGLLIWGFNELWFRALKHDAVGMGDAKWTVLAVACFGLIPSMVAWGAGAILAILWMGGMRLLRRPIGHVHFAPFLFLGLLAGIWWMRLRG